MKDEQRRQLAEKVEWEGGVLEAIVGYGMPADIVISAYGPMPANVEMAWRRIELVESAARVVENWLEGED